MYIEKTETYYKDGEQHTRRGLFLLLVQSKDRELGPDNFRAIVRKVALSQCGHWMMGRARVKGHTLIVSGSYGSDGMPMTVTEDVYQAAMPVPVDLYDAWCKGSGWNGAGSEASAFQAWACENLGRLYDVYRK